MNKSPSSVFGESTLLKKLRILPFGFPIVFEVAAFLLLCRPSTGTLLFEFGRGVSGFVELVRVVMVDIACCGRSLKAFGGVGGRPVEGTRGNLMLESDSSRGLRNIAGVVTTRHIKEVL